MAKSRPSPTTDVMVLARDVSDAIHVDGMRTVAAAFAFDPETGLILGSGIAATLPAAISDLLRKFRASAGEGSLPPRLLCAPHLASAVKHALPAAWRSAEVVSVELDASVEDIFDSLVGHLSGRQQPADLPSPTEWSMLFRQAQAFVEASPWDRITADNYLSMALRVGSSSTDRIGVVLGAEGITYGFALYPAGVEPPGGPSWSTPKLPPAGTLMLTLDPPDQLPAYMIAKARRYLWPDSLALMPVALAWTDNGPGDPSSDEVTVLSLALAAALAASSRLEATPATGDMILSAGRSGQYRVELKPVQHVASPSDGDTLTIDEALDEFLEDCRSRVSARTLRTYESVIELLRACLNSYGHQYLSESERAQLDRAYEAGEEEAFCRLFGAEKIADSVGEFLSYFMIRKVAASGDLLRASGTVTGKLMDWLAEHGAVSPEAARDARRQARAAARDLPRAARLASILLDAIGSEPPVSVETLGAQDYIEDELMISSVEPGSLWFDDDIGPVKVPKTASDLARPGWMISLALGRIRNQWRILEVGNVYP